MSVTRTHCGAPRPADEGAHITVYGWVDRRRDQGGLIFLDLRDHTGILQVVLDAARAQEAHDAAHGVRLEYVLRVEGELRRRAAENVNPRLGTGEVELHATGCAVLSAARTPPFPVNEDTDVEEQLRLRHRYLDLRRERMQHNLRARARFSTELRRAMSEQGFVEIETPLMIRSTPEGSRDYLVPSRLFPGSFYALPQSPQLYKQLCMVAGFDRYFQLAHCMRDEDLRADRQPEFTQLDIEMAFVDEEDVFAALEHAIPSAWHACEFRGSPLRVPFPRIPWREAMARYGSDKPDTRFEMLLHDVTEVARSSGFRVFAEAVARGGVVKAICVKGGDDLTRSEIEGRLTDVVRAAKARGLAYLWRRADGWQSGIAKFFSDEELERISATVGADIGDCVLMVADTAEVATTALGALRNHLARARRLYDEARVDFVWVTEFPMFERSEETGAIQPAHHPFTMLHADDVELLESDPLAVRSRAYDIVVNGREVGSGSIRITDPAIQRRVLAALGIGDAEAREKFGFLLEAFEYGVPPHGGWAGGIDRMLMEGLGTENIRDVIAFPKNQQAQEPLTQAPAPVDTAQLRELGLSLLPPRQ
ncbi:MAG: aspartate--tRNA ligase [Candidatus Dormibacteraeota bacterium]|nr:aspartate--tRNA ligase [Candidatus Dormibacteraeota bacterium]MBV9526321.1 aspartate--tRNA ligase [Candidatus Dormibacteraeota bacterium]